MVLMNPTANKILTIKTLISNVDSCASLLLQILEKKEKSDLRLLYTQHYLKEIIGLSRLVHLIVLDNSCRTFIFFPLRSSFEILLLSEHVLNMKSEDVFPLLTKDLTQSHKKLTHTGNLIYEPEDKNTARIIKSLGVFNKALRTGLDIESIRQNSKDIFPGVMDLCLKSAVNIKNLKSESMYQFIYAYYSESEHHRLSAGHSISGDDPEVYVLHALEYFIEIYIKTLEIIARKFDEYGTFESTFLSIRNDLGLKW